MIYRLQGGKSYLLYSVGANRVDDHALIDPKKIESRQLHEVGFTRHRSFHKTSSSKLRAGGCQNMISLTIENLTKRFGDATTLHDVNLIPTGVLRLSHGALGDSSTSLWSLRLPALCSGWFAN